MNTTGQQRQTTEPGRVTALGWYVLFGHVSMMDAMLHHYRKVLELPLYLHWRRADGRVEDKDHFWAGEAVILDINHGGTVRDVAPRQAAAFRVHDVTALVDRIRRKGGHVSDITPGPLGLTASVTDPMGQLVLLREAPGDSMLPHDIEARRRWARGEAYNPGCGSLPEGWQELGAVQLRAADPDRLARFYTNCLGLAEIDRRGDTILLDLGDAVVLEITGGGNVRPAPAAQMASSATFILRTRNLAHLVASLAAAGFGSVGQAYVSERGEWRYIADPEGNVVGLSEWSHPSVYCDVLPVYPEDIEAARREAEARA